MPNAEDNRLDKNRPRCAPSDRLKLLLQIATKCEFFTKPC